MMSESVKDLWWPLHGSLDDTPRPLLLLLLLLRAT